MSLIPKKKKKEVEVEEIPVPTPEAETEITEQPQVQDNSQEMMNILYNLQEQITLSETYNDPIRTNRFLVNSYRMIDQRIANLENQFANVELLLGELKKIIESLEVEEE